MPKVRGLRPQISRDGDELQLPRLDTTTSDLDAVRNSRVVAAIASIHELCRSRQGPRISA